MVEVKPIPDGYPRVIPYLSVEGANAAIDFYTAVFGARERVRMPAPNGKLGHAELEVGDSVTCWLTRSRIWAGRRRRASAERRSP